MYCRERTRIASEPCILNHFPGQVRALCDEALRLEPQEAARALELALALQVL